LTSYGREAQKLSVSSAVAAEEPRCPVCKTLCAEQPLYSYRAEEAASHFCPVTKNRDIHKRLHACIAELWGGDTCRIFRCSSCGFGFGDPFVGGNEEFYRLLHHSIGYPSWKWDYDVGMSQVVAFPSGGRIIDVGAGAGFFLRKLNDRWNRCATEGSPTTRDALRQEGICVFENLNEAVRADAGSFQLVTLYQVLEHLADFQSVLADCRRLLAPNGRIVVVVPDGDAMIRQERVTGCADMPPNHICKWTPDSLSRALTKAGLAPSSPIRQPASIKNVPGLLHLRLKSDACHPRSVAAHAYRIGNRKVRAAALSMLAVGAFVRMLPEVGKWPLSGAFAMIGTAA
jgi:SAM-dependent methyltransferase